MRYSSAKYLARLTALLPLSFQTQIISAIIALFGGTESEPCITTVFGTVIDPGGSDYSGGTMGFGGNEITRGEGRWHGVCLALAECGRRGLISSEMVGEVLEWVTKVGHEYEVNDRFDRRSGSHIRSPSGIAFYRLKCERCGIVPSLVSSQSMSCRRYSAIRKQDCHMSRVRGGI